MQQHRKPRLSIIAAVAANGVIGNANALPWHLPEDLKRFRALTLGHPVIMGRKTHESIGRPLPGRRNIIVTRNQDYRTLGCETANSLQDAIAACGTNDEEVFVIGGAQIYRDSMRLAQRIYLTEIRRNYEGDAEFPSIDCTEWRETEREYQQSQGGLEFDFVVYERTEQLSICPHK